MFIVTRLTRLLLLAFSLRGRAVDGIQH
ncbi:leu operon leader peptide [Nissabacter sp. SGAir0207]